ncbi:MAG TPA: helix-turn-helix transcriptional regulator [Actinophytocola sp.]|uniref:helix-turn-helix domain-containing protein n=1 Tax=Actinophytocola sp. TaxID=1872138 RepID=UPI002E089423|nr:helix-turn-helix transcriptional regulator [Actinophytocola sp.]
MTLNAAEPSQRSVARPFSVASGHDLASSVRRARDACGLSMSELARRIGVTTSHLSRIESGERSSVRRDVLDRIVATTNDHSIWAAARCLPPHAELELARWHSAFRVDALSRTLPLVRQIHLGEVGAVLLRDAGAERSDRIELQALTGHVGLRVTRRRATGGCAVEFIERNAIAVADEPDQPVSFRFLVAHAVAHVALNSHACAYPRRTEPQEDTATDLACWLLAPPGLLDRVARRVMARRDSWAVGGTDIAGALARELGVPLWLAIRRLGEERTLDIYAEETFGLESGAEL